MSTLPRARRRTSPAEDAEPAALSPEIDQAEDFSAKPRFLDYLAGLTPAECEQREVWIYRCQPALATGGKKASRRVEICPLPVNAEGYCNLEDYIQEKYGGGDFEIHLKLKGNGRRPNDHHGYCYLDGPPKFPAVAEASAANPSAPGATPETAVMMELIRQRDGKADNPIAQVGETIRVMKSLREELSPASSIPPPPDPIAQAAATIKLLRDLAPPVSPPSDPFEQYSRINAIITDAIAKANPNPSPRANGGGQFGVVRELLSVLKDDEEGLVRRLLVGEAEPPSGLAAMGPILGQLVSANTELLPTLGSFLVEGMKRFMARPAPEQTAQTMARVESSAGKVLPPAATPQPAPAATDAAPGLASQPITPGAPTATARPSPEVLIHEVLQIVARSFADAKSGTNVAIALDTLYPKVIPDLQGILQSADEAALWSFLQTRPEISASMADPKFPQFLTDFVDAVLAGFDEDESDDDGEEQEEGGEAPAAEPASHVAQ